MAISQIYDMSARQVWVGRYDEHGSREVAWDVSPWTSKLGSEGVFALLVTRPRDTDSPYNAQVSFDASTNLVTWAVTDVDTALKGWGRAELHYYVDGALVKSQTFVTIIEKAMFAGSTAPSAAESWVERMEQAALDAQAAAETAEDAEATATSAATTATSAAATAITAANSASSSASSARADATTATTAATAAASSASAASTSATNAAASAEAASTSALTASTAASTATTKASQASASASTAATAATTATNKASEATTAATTATTKAGEASTSASTATSAKDTAVSASQTATTKATEATTAAATATSAKTDAVAANTAAQSAKTAAQTAQTGAETAAASVSASAAQIATNAEDISQLKSDLNQTIDKLYGKVDGIRTANLFDKSTAIHGYYVGANGLVEAAGWNASEYIPVEEGKTYSASVISNARYYDSNQTRTGNVPGSPFTVPEGVKYVRLSIQDANLDTFMLVLGASLPTVYVPFGCVLSMDSFTDEIISDLKGQMGIPNGLIDNNYLHHLREHLSNPFIRTQIKFVGDSITAGQGGTGYDASGASGVLIGGTTSSYQNVTSAICFSNMFYHFISDRYNQKVNVSVADKHIDKPYVGKSSSLSKGTKTIGTFKVEYDQLTENNTIASRDFLSFDFYGTEFTIFNFVNTNKGKYDVYCDGTLLSTVDCYSATADERDENTYTGLTEGTHTVVLRTTATKNASSTLNQVIITGIAVTKCAVVVPWGISGTLSASAINTTGRYTTDDDFVILQYGTNDRHMYFSKDSTYENLINAAEIIKGTYGAEPIFMCPPPVDESFEYDSVTRYYHMWDVHDTVCRVGEYYKIPIIDNYKAFMDYLDNHPNSTLNDLLFDGLHPNDLGYSVIYDNIMDSLGLPRFPKYKAWPSE